MAAESDTAPAADGLRPQYDFRSMPCIAVGKYAAAYRESYCVVHVDADLMKSFADDAALRQYLQEHPPQEVPAA